MRILKKLRNVQNKKAKIIQQHLVGFIHRPLLVKFEDRNHQIRYKEDVRLETKIMTKIYQLNFSKTICLKNFFRALNGLAQLSRPKKKAKAENMMKEVVRESVSVLSITEAMNQYLDRGIFFLELKGKNLNKK